MIFYLKWMSTGLIKADQCIKIILAFLSLTEKGSFIVKEVEEPEVGSTPEGGIQLHRNPTFLGVVMGVGVLMLIVIICLLLIAVRAGHLNTSKFHGQ